MFDEQVVRLNPTIRPLLDQFVCVRLVQGNGLDLQLFQFDYDLTFTAFFLNADGTIYGRFGTRSERKEATRDISMEGFGKALERALDWHKNYPANKHDFVARKGPPPSVLHPEDFPAYKGKYSAKTDPARPVQSCIHCHMIGEGERDLYFSKGQSLPDKLLFPFPVPNTIGLEMDPTQCATVLRVPGGTPADKAGFKHADEIIRLEGQPLLSTADIQWVLHHAPDSGKTLHAEVRRGPDTVQLQIPLPPGWKRVSDISWRVSTWDLRRKALGGMVLKTKTEDGKPQLYVDYLGQYGEHAVALKRGFKKNDIILQIGGSPAPFQESAALHLILERYKKGEEFPLEVLRDQQRSTIKLPIQ